MQNFGFEKATILRKSDIGADLELLKKSLFKKILEVLFSTFGEDLELSNFCGKSFLNFGVI